MLLYLLDYEEKKMFKNLALIVAKSDNDFTDKEKKKIKDFCKEMNIKCDDFNNDVKLESIISFFSKKELFKRKIVVMEILCLMLVDGLVNEEREILNKLIKEFKLENNFEDKVIDWCQEYNKIIFDAFLLIGEGS